MLCSVCSLHPALQHPVLGILPCIFCKERRGDYKSPDNLYEFTTSEIKSQRKEYSKDIVQPLRGNEPSKEFIEAYPKKAEKMFTKREIRMAKNVWK